MPMPQGDTSAPHHGSSVNLDPVLLAAVLADGPRWIVAHEDDANRLLAYGFPVINLPEGERLTKEMVKRYQAQKGPADVPPHASMGFNQSWIFFTDVLPRAIKKHGGFDPEALKKAALETDIPDGGTISGYGESVGRPRSDQLELITLYASHAATSIERERMFAESRRRHPGVGAVPEGSCVCHILTATASGEPCTRPTLATSHPPGRRDARNAGNASRTTSGGMKINGSQTSS